MDEKGKEKRHPILAAKKIKCDISYFKRAMNEYDTWQTVAKDHSNPGYMYILPPRACCLIAHPSQVALLMDMANGSLEEHIEISGTLSIEEVRTVAFQLCSALKHIHNLNVVSRYLSLST